MTAANLPVTVFIPTYNAAPFIKDAIDSILAQTFGDFELLVVDDGSTDGTPAIVAAIPDPRIRLIRLEPNRGVSAAANVGLKEARGRFLMRFDSDDIALPARVARQLDYMLRHPDLAISGTWMENFGAITRSTVGRLPEGHDDIAARFLFKSGIYNPTAMMALDPIRAAGLTYDEDVKAGEDYRFWIQAVASGLRFANVPENLHRYRVHATQLTQTRIAETRAANVATRRILLAHFGVPHTAGDAELHDRIASGTVETTAAFREQAARWLERIVRAADALPEGPRRAIRHECLRRYRRITRRGGLGALADRFRFELAMRRPTFGAPR